MNSTERTPEAGGMRISRRDLLKYSAWHAPFIAASLVASRHFLKELPHHTLSEECQNPEGQHFGDPQVQEEQRRIADVMQKVAKADGVVTPEEKEVIQQEIIPHETLVFCEDERKNYQGTVTGLVMSVAGALISISSFGNVILSKLKQK